MKQFLLLFFTFFLFFSSYSQNNKNLIFESIQNGRAISYGEIPEFSDADFEILTQKLLAGISDGEDPSFRLRAYRFMYLAGQKHPELSPNVVHFLTFEGLSDSNNGNRISVCNFLDSFPGFHFSSAVKNQIASYVINATTPFEEIALLAARLNLKDLVPHFEHLLQTQTFEPKKEWVIRIVLGRMGDADAADWCIRQVQNIGMNDLVVFELLPDLVFMNYKPAVDFLLQTIMKDERNCSSPNPDSNTSINCAYRILELVAPIIVDFPVEVDEYGELLTNDYKESLVQAREWIVRNQDNYSLKKNNTE